jgi:hypothetical protein
MRRNQISPFGETYKSISFGGGVSSVDYWQASCTHRPAGFVQLMRACVLQSCDAYWLPTPFCFPFTSPPVCHRVPSRLKRSFTQFCNLIFVFYLLVIYILMSLEFHVVFFRFMTLYTVRHPIFCICHFQTRRFSTEMNEEMHSPLMSQKKVQRSYYLLSIW